MYNIGQKIKELRKRSDLTQEKLADYLGVSYQAVSKWETGIACPDLSLIVPLARLFGVTTDELLGMNANAEDEKRTEYQRAYDETLPSGDLEKRYQIAREAVIDFPDDFDFLLRWAEAEYALAHREGYSLNCSAEYFEEMIDNAMRHYEQIIDHCGNFALRNRAILGMFQTLKLCGRMIEAEWYAEVVYPENGEMTRAELLDILSKEDE
ncbi:MAG: helix-turn-helix transcriptional regulator [Clostridia bacterium]|nr:helix-turn-helix transcriptional regulator [Clostridia bacterium]